MKKAPAKPLTLQQKAQDRKRRMEMAMGDKPAAKKPARRSLEELRNMPRKEGVMQERTIKGRKPVAYPMATEIKRKK